MQSLTIYVPEEMYKYDVSKVNDVPPQEIFESAFQNKNPILSYRKIIPSRYSIKYILYKMRLPVLFGMSVFDSFFELTKEKDILPVPTKNDQAIGMHAVLIVGFDSESDAVIILNSHGPSFGCDGYFRMPFEYLLNSDLCFEFYCLSN